MYIKFNEKINPLFQSPVFKMCYKNARNAITENVQPIRVILKNICETLIHFRSKWRSLSNLRKQLKIRHGNFYKQIFFKKSFEKNNKMGENAFKAFKVF